jgi:hypothetical protein
MARIMPGAWKNVEERTTTQDQAHRTWRFVGTMLAPGVATLLWLELRVGKPPVAELLKDVMGTSPTTPPRSPPRDKISRRPKTA